MKKSLLALGVLLIGGAVYAGSANVLVDDMFGVGIFCDADQMTYVDHKLPSMKGVTVLGKVEAKRTIVSVLSCFTVGDTSMETLKSEALQAYPEADDIVNMEIDTHVLGVFFVAYKQVAVTLHGIAVRYNK